MSNGVQFFIFAVIVISFAARFFNRRWLLYLAASIAVVLQVIVSYFHVELGARAAVEMAARDNALSADYLAGVRAMKGEVFGARIFSIVTVLCLAYLAISRQSESSDLPPEN